MKDQEQRAHLPNASTTFSRQTKFWMIFSSVVVLLVIVGVPVVGRMTFGRAPRVGDCLETEGRGGKTGSRSEFHIVSCTAPTAAYRAAMSVGFSGCDNNTYGYVHTGSSRSSTQLCLILNAKVGDCFYQEVGFPNGRATKVTCGPLATYRVAAVVPGRADPSVCGADINPLESDPTKPLALVYSRPKLTICTVVN